jgi:hypothetical protein
MTVRHAQPDEPDGSDERAELGAEHRARDHRGPRREAWRSVRSHAVAGAAGAWVALSLDRFMDVLGAVTGTF